MIDIWYHIQGTEPPRRPTTVNNFTGKNISQLAQAIVYNSRLDISPDVLELHVKPKGAGEGVDLYDIEKEETDFNKLITDYEIKKLNPIIVRLPGMLLVLLFLSWL